VTQAASTSGLFEKIELSDHILHVREEGEGENLLVLHGWGGSIQSVRPISERLTNNFHVITPDLVGHGGSSMPPENGPWGTADYVRSIKELLDKLNIKKTDIIGHSHGGRIGIYFAAHYPERVGKLVLVNSAGIKPPRSLKYRIKVAISKIGKFAEKYLGSVGKKLKQLLYKQIASTDYQNAGPLRATFVKLVNEDFRELLPKITAKTLLVWGRLDNDTPLAVAKQMQSSIPDSELVVLENAGHYSYLDQPVQFLLHVKRFLAG
jgi:pimeloyl-ACP methyl ester carboxylesterase